MGRKEVREFLIRNPGVKTGYRFEYAAGVGALQKGLSKVPVVGKKLAAPLSRFDRFFGFSGDMARIELGMAMESMFVKEGMVGQLGTFVNRMTGVMNSEALGISANQRAIERLLLFAPQYTRACLAYIGYVGQNNIMGREAIKSMARLYVSGTAMYVASCLALGQEPSLDPTKPTFYTVKVGNRRVGIGGFQYSFLRFMADSLQSITSAKGAEPLDFTKMTDRKNNPILKWLYSRSSPMVGITTEGFTQVNYMGEPLDSLEAWMNWLVVEKMLPISLQEQIPGPYQESPTNRGAIMAAEWFGLRTYEDELFYELADEYADAAYGKEWSDLWRPTKAGSYVQSDEQKKLLAAHPDLKAAYDKWKPLQTKKWQIAHNLLPDDNAINDYYARQVFYKPWDKLTRTEKKQVEQYREFAEEAEELAPTTSAPPNLGGMKLPGL